MNVTVKLRHVDYTVGDPDVFLIADVEVGGLELGPRYVRTTDAQLRGLLSDDSEWGDRQCIEIVKLATRKEFESAGMTPAYSCRVGSQPVAEPVIVES